MNIFGIDSKKLTLWLTAIFLVSALLAWSILEISDFRGTIENGIIGDSRGTPNFLSIVGENNSEIYEKFSAEQVQQINKIIIKLSFEDVNIQKSEDNAIHIWYQGNSRYISKAKELFSITRANQELLLESNWKGLGIHSKGLQLILRLPTENLNLQEFGIFTSSGDMKISNIQTDSLEARTYSGDIEMQDSSSQSFLVKTISGNVNITNQLSRENIKIATVSGDVDAKILKPGKVIKINSVSGDIDLYLPPDIQLKLNTTTTAGQIDSDFPISSLKSARKKIENSTPDTDYPLKVTIKTVSGDIEIMKFN